MVTLEMTEAEALCLRSNILFAVDRLHEYHLCGLGWDPPEIGDEVTTLNEIAGRLPKPSEEES